MAEIESTSETEPVTLKLSDVKKLQETVETFQTVLGSIAKGDGESHQVDVATPGPSCSGMSRRIRKGMFSNSKLLVRGIFNVFGGGGR